MQLHNQEKYPASASAPTSTRSTGAHSLQPEEEELLLSRRDDISDGSSSSSQSHGRDAPDLIDQATLDQNLVEATQDFNTDDDIINDDDTSAESMGTSQLRRELDETTGNGPCPRGTQTLIDSI